MAQNNEPTIDQMNEAIALFDGFEKYEDQYGIWFKREGLIKCMHPKLQELAYHTSWSRLMPVVEKIENLGNNVRIYTGHTTIIKNGFPICQIVHESKINAIYIAVYKFITWLNQQNQPNATTENNAG